MLRPSLERSMSLFLVGRLDVVSTVEVLDIVVAVRGGRDHAESGGQDSDREGDLRRHLMKVRNEKDVDGVGDRMLLMRAERKRV